MKMNINKIGAIGLYVIAMLFASAFMATLRMNHIIGTITGSMLMFASGTVLFFLYRMATDRG
jgi:hypothetical protein